MPSDKERLATLEECVERLETDIKNINTQLSSVLELLHQSKGILRFLQLVAVASAGFAAVLVSLKELFPTLFK